MAERTLIIVKPDGVQRRCIGEIISRFERKGLKLVAAKFIHISPEQAQQHYAVHKGKHFYDNLVSFLSCSPVMVMVWEAKDIIKISRKLMGETFGAEATPGTIRGDLACCGGYNLVHGSDSPESAEFEIGLYFNPEDVLDYTMPDAHWTAE